MEMDIDEAIDELEYPHRSEAILRYLYHECRMTQGEIGDKLDCAEVTVGKWMRRNGIETRSPNPQESRTRLTVREEGTTCVKVTFQKQ